MKAERRKQRTVLVWTAGNQQHSMTSYGKFQKLASSMFLKTLLMGMEFTFKSLLVMYLLSIDVKKKFFKFFIFATYFTFFNVLYFCQRFLL
jgi:hypothetical protein